MKILYITPYVPSPIRTRPYNLIRALLRLDHSVTLLSAAGGSSQEREEAAALRDWGVQVEVFPVSPARSLANCIRALLTYEPLQAVYSYHPQMERRLRELLQKSSFDVVHIEHLRAARLVRAARDIPRVYDSVDCTSLLFEQASRLGAQFRSRLMTRLDLGRTRYYEAWLLEQFDQVVVTSRRDKEALEGLARRYAPPEARVAPITVVTNGVDLEYFHPRACSARRDGRTVVFTGKMSYHANISAALYFARQVLPRIWARDPEVRFQIVGKDPPEALRRLAEDGRIEVTGYVEDIRPYLARAAVAVWPALYAVGLQNKVLEAMAMGTPVVSTLAGCAALEAERGRDLLLADGPEEMADAVLRVLADPGLAGQLSAAGRRYVEEHHSWEAGAQVLLSVYEKARSEANG